MISVLSLPRWQPCWPRLSYCSRIRHRRGSLRHRTRPPAARASTRWRSKRPRSPRPPWCWSAASRAMTQASAPCARPWPSTRSAAIDRCGCWPCRSPIPMARHWAFHPPALPIVSIRSRTRCGAGWARQAPDLVLIANDEDAGLAAALGAQQVADMGAIPAKHWSARTDWVKKLGPVAKSPAHVELDSRRARTPRQLAAALAQHYGRDFDQTLYIGAIALARAPEARRRRRREAAGRALGGPARRTAWRGPARCRWLGHIVFTELARQTQDPRYTRAGAQGRGPGLRCGGQDAGGHALQRRLQRFGVHGHHHPGAGRRTHRRAQVLRHGRPAPALHGEARPATRRGCTATGRKPTCPGAAATAFAALGLALTLSDLPRDSGAYAHALQGYRNLMKTLLPLQTRDGLWRNVVNHPGAYAEFSGTAMIGFALQRGLKNGWLKGREYQLAVDHAWLAVNSRAAASGSHDRRVRIHGALHHHRRVPAAPPPSWARTRVAAPWPCCSRRNSWAPSHASDGLAADQHPGPQLSLCRRDAAGAAGCRPGHSAGLQLRPARTQWRRQDHAAVRCSPDCCRRSPARSASPASTPRGNRPASGH